MILKNTMSNAKRRYCGYYVIFMPDSDRNRFISTKVSRPEEKQNCFHGRSRIEVAITYFSERHLPTLDTKYMQTCIK